jgi:hypothetical protein
LFLRDKLKETVVHARGLEKPALSKALAQVEREMHDEASSAKQELVRMRSQIKRQLATKAALALAGFSASYLLSLAPVVPMWVPVVSSALTGLGSGKDVLDAILDYRQRRRSLQERPAFVMSHMFEELKRRRSDGSEREP